MAWLAGILEPLLEKFLIWVFNILQKDYLEWKQKRDEESRVQANAEKVKQSKTDQELLDNVKNNFNGD